MLKIYFTLLQEVNHDHPPLDHYINENQIRDAILKEIDANPFRTIRDVFDNYINNLPANDRQYAPAWQTFRPSLERRRAENLPRIPHRVQDVRIQGAWRETRDGGEFLRKVDRHWGFASFSSTAQMRALADAEVIHIDATFKSTPRPYKQMLVIQARYLDHIVPVAYVFMKRRTMNDYRAVLRSLKTKCRRLLGRQLDPRIIVSDFEAGLVTALQFEFINAESYGCYFHFCNALWKNVQKLGLKRPYRRDDRFRHFIRKVTALAFIPRNFVLNNWNLLKGQPGTVRLTQQYPDLRRFLHYFESSYILGQFPIRQWNVHTRGLDTRTNNVQEGMIFYVHAT